MTESLREIPKSPTTKISENELEQVVLDFIEEEKETSSEENSKIARALFKDINELIIFQDSNGLEGGINENVNPSPLLKKLNKLIKNNNILTDYESAYALWRVIKNQAQGELIQSN